MFDEAIQSHARQHSVEISRFILAQAYRRAAFCIEELILLNPMAYMYHLRYADIMYTIGTTEKGSNHETIRTARKCVYHVWPT